MGGDGAFQLFAEVVDVVLVAVYEAGCFNGFCQDGGGTFEFIYEVSGACGCIDAFDTTFFEHLLQNCGLAGGGCGR